MKYLIKLGSEITIKSDAVRRECIKLLKRNIILHFDHHEIDIRLEGNWDRIVLEVSDLENQENITGIVSCISGIEHFSSIIDCRLSEEIMNNSAKLFSEIAQICIQHFQEEIQGRSFAVKVRRVGDHDFQSPTLERYIGEQLIGIDQNSKINLTSPNIKIHIDIRDNEVYILRKQFPGLSGFPVGFQAKALSLISGGFDSSVAAQAMINRGCKIDYLFFNLGGDVHELGVKHMSHHVWSSFSLPYKKARFISIPFEDVITAIIRNIPSRFRGIVLKRCMLKVVSEFSPYYCGAIKGDSVGQVSSQTLQNLRVIDAATNMLILRPLIGMNKGDIMDQAKRIGIYDAAAAMPEYCGIVSQRPETKAVLEDVLEAEKNLGENLLKTALQNRKIERVSDMLFSYNQIGNIPELRELGNGELIIDIREPGSIKKSPLSQKRYKASYEIPFYEINHRFEKLDQTKQYVLYCDKGVLSHLHGLYLKEKGFTNIKVLRP